MQKSQNTAFNDFYNTSKKLWAKYIDELDEYDWNILATKVAESSTSFIEGEYLYYFIKAVDKFKDWVVYSRNLPLSKIVERKELAEIIRIYHEDQDAVIIPALSRYQTMKVNKGKAKEIQSECEIEMECEWEKAHEILEDVVDNDFDENCDFITA
jgi:hypothetical protein